MVSISTLGCIQHTPRHYNAWVYKMSLWWGYLWTYKWVISIQCFIVTGSKILPVVEPPKEPRISDKQCIISDSSAYIELSYNETVRAKQMTLHYQESLYKGLSEKDWQQVEVCAYHGADDIRQVPQCSQFLSFYCFVIKYLKSTSDVLSIILS